VSGAARERVLLTGATGFIGGHLAQRLAQDGWTVRCLVRASSDTARLERLGVELAVGDLADAGSLARAAAGCERVVHCGAIVSDWGTRAEISAVNVAGTRNVVEAAAAAGARRLVHVSSTDVYAHPGAAVDESHRPTRFSNWYAETKLAAEAEVARAAAASGLEAVVVRPATVYGPRSVEVVGEIATAIRGKHMVLIDRGRSVAGLTYVDNVVDAIVLALRHEAAAGEAFNVSDGLDVTWRRFTDDLAAALDRPPVRFSLPFGLANALAIGLEQGYRGARRLTGLTTRPLLSRQAVHVMGADQRFDTRKARELLGWQPRVGYAEGMEATVAWLRDELVGT
jgi:nucleoside-diphosphate-sugar epimerase